MRQGLAKRDGADTDRASEVMDELRIPAALEVARRDDHDKEGDQEAHTKDDGN